MQAEPRNLSTKPMTDQPPKPRRRRPTIVANPAADRRFVARVEHHLGTVASAPPDLEHALRAEYPDVVVRRREISGEPVEVWYVYRDGHWIGADPERAG